MRKLTFLALGLALIIGAVSMASAQMAKPEMATVSGTLADLTCAVKGKAMMDSWANAENNEHMTPDGAAPGCAAMCLKGGQPAGLYSDGDMIAVLACNPKETLANYAAQEVELQGFWGGGEATKNFVPAKIRAAGGEWEDVNCATMHG